MGGLAVLAGFDAADRLGGGPPAVLVSSPTRSMAMVSAATRTVTICRAFLSDLHEAGSRRRARCMPDTLRLPIRKLMALLGDAGRAGRPHGIGPGGGLPTRP